jgi:hypothetical protein
MDELKPIFKKYPFLIRPAALCTILAAPFFVTYVLWRDEWSEIKETFSFLWGLIRDGKPQ